MVGPLIAPYEVSQSLRYFRPHPVSNHLTTDTRVDAGIKVVSSHLKATVEGLEGIDKAKLDELATGAEKGCPISNAIRGTVAITVEAQAV